jgi:carbonic anhydrase
MCSHANANTNTASRRDVLRSVALTGAVTLATGALPRALDAMPLANGSMHRDHRAPGTPTEALDMLYRGNARFVEGKITAPHRNMDRLKEVASGQKPFAAFLGCADSRVPIEIVFDQGFGDVFVTRIAGNVADPAIIGSLEFGVEVLGAQVLYVLGHAKCGAVSATLKGDAVPGQISTLYQHIRRAAKDANGNLDVAIRRNVEIQAEILSEASPVLAKRLADKSLIIAGGIYDLESGTVTPVVLPAR